MEMEVPRPIKIDESVIEEIIDLDDFTSSSERARKWNDKVRRKIAFYFADENEENLRIIMKWYIETLNEDISEIEDTELLLQFIDKHIQFFHLYFQELTWASVDNYLDSMEDIVAVYLDLLCDRFGKDLEQKQNKTYIRKIWQKIMKYYLLDQEEHIYHTLMKIKLNLATQRTKDFLDNLFRVLLSTTPKNTSDLAFCRSYIVHQRWKKVQKPETHKSIDELMYRNYSRTADVINTNPIIKEVLQPQNDSVLDVLVHIKDSDKMLCESYFKYVKLQKMQADNITVDVTRIELDSSSDNEEATLDLESSSLPNRLEIEGEDIKAELSDDDCVIIGEGTLDCNPNDTEIVHEILDDDDDIASIIYFTSKHCTTNYMSTRRAKREEQQEVSFLDSIKIIETDTNKENTSTETHSPSVSPAPSPKLHNLDNDSVKSREILSRKFTRKKEDNVAEMVIEIDETRNDGCTFGAEANDWDGTKPNNDTEEPSHRFEGLVTPPTSHDDLHSYERDFHNPDLQEINEAHEEEEQRASCFDSSINNKEAESDMCNTPHSTNSNNADSDVCNVPTSLPEIQSNGSWVSPTSPDISTTCAPVVNLAPEEVPEITVEQRQELEELHEEISIKESPKINEVPKKNGNIVEHNNNREEKKGVIEKQLKVSMARIDVSAKSPEKKMEILFTSKQKVNKLDNEVHIRYNDLKGAHGLDDCLSGAIEKISCPSQVVANFDLFDDNSPSEESPSLPSPRPNVSTSPSSITSPDFDGIDDFKSYLANYQEESNKKATMISKKPNQLDKAQASNKEEDQGTRLNNKNPVIPNVDRVSEPQVKRKRIAFADKDIVDYVNPHEPIIKHNSRLQSILKKPLRNSRWRIPRDQMNMQSLNHYRVKPNDPCLQGEPCVVIERLSETEISEWHQVSELSRSIRMQRFKNYVSPKSVSPLSMTMLRVDYDKSTPWLTENDTVLYRVPEGMSWRPNAQLSVEALDEGTVDSDSEEYFYIPTICKNSCCCNILADLKSLTLDIKPQKIADPTPFFSIPINPFSPKIVGKDKTGMQVEDYCAKSSFIDLNVVHKMVENFDKCDEPANPFDFINQPAIVPEVEEFEKTLKMNEEVPKVSNIPSDLHNLNLRKFSPSPIMNCFSPHSSPAYTYFSDYSNFNDRINSFQDFETDRNLILESQAAAEANSEELSGEELEEPKIWITVTEEPEAESKEDVHATEEDATQENKIICPRTDLNASTEEEPEARLPLKKRKHSVANAKGADSDEETIGPEVIEEIIKKARAEKSEKEDISYPAKPAISIAEIQEKLERPRTFKTPAQKKEMPPPPVPDAQPSPKIVTEQYNNHTYNNPTINYHMNNVPYPFFPCTSLTYFPPIILPLNSTTTFDMNVMNSNSQQSTAGQQVPPSQENIGKVKKEKRSKRRKKE